MRVRIGEGVRQKGAWDKQTGQGCNASHPRNSRTKRRRIGFSQRDEAKLLMPAKLFTDDVEMEIVARRQNGESTLLLEAIYSISGTTIRRLCRKHGLDLAALRTSNKLSERTKELRKYSGLTEDEYDEILAAQGGVCGICKRTCPSGRKLAVDHDHETLAIRGLLCMRCNNGIGQFDDDPKLLAEAIHYLLEGCNYCPPMKGATPWQKEKK